MDLKKISPQISVGMPVYNGELYLEEAICCILNQTYDDFEFIISDNASTDRTEQICRDYASRDKRILYFRNVENMGAAKNYNRVFNLSSGKYFRWFNSDDLCSPKYHEKCIRVLNENHRAVLCYGKTNIIDNKGNLIEKYEDNLDLPDEKASSRFIKLLERVGHVNSIYGLMKTSAVVKTMLMGNGSYLSADIRFLAELTLYGKFIEIPEQLFFRRMHKQASSWDRENVIAQQIFWNGKNVQCSRPNWKKHYAYLVSIYRSPIIAVEKCKLYCHIFKRMTWIRKYLFFEIYHTIKNGFARKKLI